jgi:hypothetical protein
LPADLYDCVTDCYRASLLAAGSSGVLRVVGAVRGRALARLDLDGAVADVEALAEHALIAGRIMAMVVTVTMASMAPGHGARRYSTVTDLARLRGLSTSLPRARAA